MVNMSKVFHIIACDCFEQRVAHKQNIYPIQVNIPDYQQTDNYLCNMIVSYSDYSIKSLIGKVIYNKLKQKWTVDGMAVAVNVDDIVDTLANNDENFTVQQRSVG